MFEKRHQPLLPRHKYLLRVLRSFVIASALVLGSLAIGVLGYHHLEKLSWLDSLLTASMILTGMGPVYPLQSVAGKWFASFYALFSGLVFITASGVLLVPVFHRFMHKFHLDITTDDSGKTPRHEAPGKK